jgi:uncharacterized protein
MDGRQGQDHIMQTTRVAGRFSGGLMLLLPVLAGVALVALAFWAATKFVEPPPPDRMTIATATKGSPYYALAERYKTFLAKNGVTLDIRETNGSFENIKLLADPASGVQMGFIQGGLANSSSAPGLSSLGRVMYEPLWIFHNADVKIERIADLKGKRVLVGPAGGGTNALATRILDANDVTAENSKLVNMELPDYVAALESGQADAGFLVLAAGAKTVQRLFDNPKVKLLNIAQADAYGQRYPFLSPLELKQGVVNFAKNIPAADTTLVATKAVVAARDDLHPALANLMTQALIAVHAEPAVNAKGEAAIFSKAGEFPISNDPELALSEQARRVYKSGPPFMQRFLPFGLATLFDRLIVLAVPLIGVLFPVMKLAPMIYTWQVRQRLLHWYKALKRVEHGFDPKAGPAALAAKLAEVDDIEEAVNGIPIPLGFTNQLYDLRAHIDVVRRRLAKSQVA